MSWQDRSSSFPKDQSLGSLVRFVSITCAASLQIEQLPVFKQPLLGCVSFLRGIVFELGSVSRGVTDKFSW
jgi:hypothetical protein